MTPAEAQARLDQMAADIYERRRADIAESIALRLFRANGSVDQAAVDAAVDAEWEGPDSQTVRDLVARKVQAAVAHEGTVAEHARTAVANSEAKVAKFRDLLAAVEADHAALISGKESDAATARAVEWQELLDAAVAGGADPGRAPQGRNLGVSPIGAGG